MKYLLFILFFPLFAYNQTLKVSIIKAEIDDWGLGKSLGIEYRPDSLRIDGVSQARINDAEITFSDGRHSKLVFSDYYDIANPNPSSVVFFKPPKKKVTLIKSITGKIQYYNPTIENGDIKILENPRTKINTRIFNELIGFEFYMVDVNTLLQHKELPKAERYLQVQKLLGLSFLSSDFKKSLDNFYGRPEKSSIGAFFWIYDPLDTFFTIRIMDKNGEMRNPGYASSSDSVWKYFQLHGDSLDQKLAFLFYTKNSVKEFNFNCSNIKIENTNGL